MLVKFPKNRYFIVGPTESGVAVGDTLWQLCRTTKHWGIHDIYMYDQYDVIKSTGSEKSIRSLAKKYGCKRPTII